MLHLWGKSYCDMNIYVTQEDDEIGDEDQQDVYIEIDILPIVCCIRVGVDLVILEHPQG